MDINKEPNVQVQSKRTVTYHAKTLFLFTKSDFKTVVFPQAAFSLAFAYSQVAYAQVSSRDLVLRIPHMLVWIWLHLLVEDISNQRLAGSVVEDGINKPWRPIPAGRLTPGEAESVLRICVLLAMVMSAALGGFGASTTLMALVWLYNDLGGSGVGPLQRNAINAAGLCCFGWGGVSVLFGSVGANGHLDEHSQMVLGLRLPMWLALSAAVITTTIHAQDLPDVEGDRARGRKTMPLLYGDINSRWTLAVSVVAWSFVCPAFWHVASPLVWSASIFLGSAIASLAMLQKNTWSDTAVWRLWCLWITVLYLLPLFGYLRV